MIKFYEARRILFILFISRPDKQGKTEKEKSRNSYFARACVCVCVCVCLCVRACVRQMVTS
jgi:hypothetical protein